MATRLDAPVLGQLFSEARTRNGWDPEPLPDSLLREIYELAKWGPTAANSTPARFVFSTFPNESAPIRPIIRTIPPATSFAAA